MSSEVLPYTVEPHPVTGLYSGKFGIWLFLASEVMLFGGLFSTYILLRVGASEGDWPVGEAETHLSVNIGMLNTIVLIMSSITMVMAWAALKMKNIGQARGWLAATLALAEDRAALVELTKDRLEQRIADRAAQDRRCHGYPR